MANHEDSVNVYRQNTEGIWLLTWTWTSDNLNFLTNTVSIYKLCYVIRHWTTEKVVYD